MSALYSAWLGAFGNTTYQKAFHGQRTPLTLASFPVAISQSRGSTITTDLASLLLNQPAALALLADPSFRLGHFVGNIKHTTRVVTNGSVTTSGVAILPDGIPPSGNFHSTWSGVNSGTATPGLTMFSEGPAIVSSVTRTILATGNSAMDFYGTVYLFNQP